ncbi:hypothetical protein [Bacillus sp. Marseille-P3800]|uniref:hypothetical protein n=1 Tax=Bacillus sp. Marseille-P3800 TaxID=2014782 RepID=UPI000C07278F|nr:hypothetical protein [Bacillus sp. Marseille-P3800]
MLELIRLQNSNSSFLKQLGFKLEELYDLVADKESKEIIAHIASELSYSSETNLYTEDEMDKSNNKAYDRGHDDGYSEGHQDGVESAECEECT